MPLTSAEKQTCYVEKLTVQGKYEQFKKKYRQISQKNKQKQKAPHSTIFLEKEET